MKKLAQAKEENKKLQAHVAGTAVKLPDTFKSTLITPELLKAIKPTAESIQTLLGSQAKIELRLGEELFKLKNQILAFATKRKLSSKEAAEAFNEFIQETFNLGSTRAEEYIKVANKKDLHGLKLPISSLVELARLPDDSLKRVLKDTPQPKLAEMSFRGVQALVRENNENKRERATAGEAETTEASKGSTERGPTKLSVVSEVSDERDLAIVFDEDAEDFEADNDLESSIQANPSVTVAGL